MNTQKLESLATFVVSEAKRLGATDCDVSISQYDSVECGVRLGEVEEFKTAKGGRGLKFRALVGKKSAVTNTSDFRRDAIRKVVRSTIAMAKETEADEFAGMPEAHQFAKSIPALALFDDTLSKLDAARKLDMAMKCEAAARTADPRVTNSEGASFSDHCGAVVLANSRGFMGAYSGSNCSIGASIIASEDGKMQVGSWYHSSRTLAGLDSADSVGKEAARRALRHLGARKVKSQEVPVVFDHLMSARLLGQFIGAAHGSHVYRKSSFLAGKVGEVVAVKDLVIVDDGLIPGALGSHPFDGEGLPTTKRVLVQDGKLQSYLVDSYSGRKLGLEPNGGSTANLFIKAGTLSPEEIIKSVKSGLYLTSVSGPGFNAVSGDYSMGASGIWIENGELAYPVEEITVAGNVLEMFQSIEAIGNDLAFRSRTCAPTLKIGKMMVAGS